MASLKEIRSNLGLTQIQVADILKVNQSLVCNYENDLAYPDLEDAVILENEFSQKIDWNEKLSPKQKHNVVQSIIELYEKYPIEMVSEFVARVYRRNQSPENFIVHYGNLVSKDNIEPLFPVEFDNNK